MEWTLSVNEILKECVTKLNYTLIPPGFQGDVRSVRLMQESLSKIIDNLGNQSASAQGLNKVITTAEKLTKYPTQILYLLKDAHAKGGKGDVIGLLKVGRKHLFLFNHHDKVCEVEPLCVLDFFVLQQRLGHGKILFDHMLEDQGVAAPELAIDGPSPKMEKFLSKNYGIGHLVRQNNNFAVSPLFFNTVKETSKSGCNTPMTTAAVGRFAAPKPSSAIANIIHGGSSAQQQVAGVSSRISDTKTPMTTRSVGRFSAPQPSTIAIIHGGSSPQSQIARTSRRQSPGNEDMVISSDAQIEELAGNQRSSGSTSTIKEKPLCQTPTWAVPPAGLTVSRRRSQLTDLGYFDIKYYHHKIWTPRRGSPEREDIVESNGAAAAYEPEPMPEPEDLAGIQKSQERPSTLKVEPVSETPAPALSPAGSTVSRRDSQLTDRGYFDVKFYHNKLW